MEEDLKLGKDIEELQKRIIENAKKIEKITKQIESNAGKIENNAGKIEYNSGALEILHTFKSDSRKFFIMWIITFMALLGLLGYTIYLLNDIGTFETTTQEVSDFDTINGNVVNKGDVNG